LRVPRFDLCKNFEFVSIFEGGFICNEKEKCSNWERWRRGKNISGGEERENNI
jgi:hypothetical protein